MKCVLMNTPARILMIDDDANLVSVIGTVLLRSGFEFFSAHTASMGLQRIIEVKPDLIILDVIMEDFVAGFRVVSELRTSRPDSPYKRFERVPIVMLTSVTSKTTLDFSGRVGTALLPVDVFLEKPVKPAQLLQSIDALLAESAATTREREG